MKKKTAVLLLALTIATPLAAQFTESVEVRVTNVDVVVTDRNGKPVPGLKREDFQIFEDGKPQPVTNFYEVRPDGTIDAAVTGGALQAAEPAPAPPAEARKRRILIFIDNYTTHPFRRNDLFRAIDHSLDTLMRPGDEVELAAWSRGLRVVQPFTTDRDALRKALNAEMNRSAGLTYGSDRDLLRKQINDLLAQARNSRNAGAAYEEARSMVRAYRDQIEHIERSFLTSLTGMISTLGGLEGKKVLVYAGGALPERPALELFQYVNNLFMPYVHTTSNPFADAASVEMPQRMEKLAKSANANGVTMYMLNASDIGEAIPSAAVNDAGDLISDFTAYTNTAQALSRIADLTGGIALSNSRNYEGAIQTVARDLDSYYSLGYRSPEGEKRQRRIVVKVRNPELRVRARQTYEARTAEEQASDRAVANIYHATKSDMPVRIQTGKPVKKSWNRFEVPVAVAFPPALTLLPQGNDELAGGFTVYVVMGDADGALSDVSRLRQPVTIKASELKDFQSKPVVFTVGVVTQKGKHTLSVAVVDQIANTTGFGRTEIDVK
jgi:VWFA-related protein